MIWVSQIRGFGSINLKSIQAENLSNVVPATSRSSNYIALRFCGLPSVTNVSLSSLYSPKFDIFLLFCLGDYFASLMFKLVICVRFSSDPIL